MRIRPYIESKDYEYLEKWIDNETLHAMWSANRLPYPLTRENLRILLEKNVEEFTDSAYVATEDNGRTVGFFCYSVNTENNAGFLKFIVVDNGKRGMGYGGKMLRLALQYAFSITGAEVVRLCVFDNNEAAKHCYEKVGFVIEESEKDAFPYHDEMWTRNRMMITKQSLLAKLAET